MLQKDLDVTLLLGLEPEDLHVVDDATARLAAHKFVVALTPFSGPSLEAAANLMLPIGTFAETSGTFVNCEGRWQGFAGIANPVGEARPGWKVLRVLGNLLDVAGFDYVSTEEIRDELISMVGEVSPDNRYKAATPVKAPNGADDAAQSLEVPIYQVDALVRRASALQLTPEALRCKGKAS